MMEQVNSQTEMILRYLKDKGSITPYDALKEFGCLRLGARIWDLRDLGYQIDTVMETHTNKYGKKIAYARYRLEG